MPSLLCIKRILTLLLIASALVSVSACGQASAGPAFTKEEAIKRATEDAKLSCLRWVSRRARIDKVTAELITLEEADRRFGGERGPGGTNTHSLPARHSLGRWRPASRDRRWRCWGC